MIERVQRGINLEGDSEGEMCNGNRIIEKEGKWFVQLDDGSSIELPARLGQVLHWSLKLVNKHINKEGPFFHYNDKDKDIHERILCKFDCHNFTALGLGLHKLRIERHNTDGYTFIENSFKKAESRVVNSQDDFYRMVSRALDDKRIGVVAVKVGIRLTHSFFVFKGDKSMYIAEKTGVEGPPLFGDSEYMIDNIIEHHGVNMACITYEDMVSMLDNK